MPAYFQFPTIALFAYLNQEKKAAGMNNEATTVGDVEEELEDFQDELDELDLLTSAPKADISKTAKAFNTRIQRKTREKKEAVGVAEKAAQNRQTVMLQSMMQIRKSMREVTRIDLGDRFMFQFVADDSGGWPRLSIKLKDREYINEDYPGFAVICHDRQAKAEIEITYHPLEKPERIHLVEETQVKRLPLILRKCVRVYLDMVADIVLEAVGKPTDTEDEELMRQRNSDSFNEKSKQEEHPHSLSADLYEDDFGNDEILETLPSLGDVEDIGRLDGFED